MVKHSKTHFEIHLMVIFLWKSFMMAGKGQHLFNIRGLKQPTISLIPKASHALIRRRLRHTLNSSQNLATSDHQRFNM